MDRETNSDTTAAARQRPALSNRSREVTLTVS
jgi:hypothetical protein